MTLKEMRQRVADLKADGRAKQARLDEIAALEGDDVTDAVAAEAEKLAAECEQLADDLEAAVAERDIAERKLRNDRLFAADFERPAGANAVFDPNPATTHGFSHMAEFAASVRAASRGGTVDERLVAPFGTDAQGAPVNFHREGGEEGYLVPPAMRDGIINAIGTYSDPLMDEVDTEPTSGNSVSMLKDETTPWGAAGLQAAWGGEGVKLDASRIEAKGTNVKVDSLRVFVLASEELVSDAARLGNLLTVKSGEAIAYKSNEAIVSGSGIGQPLGYRGAGAYVTVAKEQGQDAATIVPANIAKMLSRMLPGSLARAHWRINSEVLPQLMTMTLGDQPIWTPPRDGFRNAPHGFLFGRPIRDTEHNEALGTVGDIELVDPLGYFSPRKANGVTFAESMHLFFDYSVNAYRWTFRMGGTPILSAPVQPAKGSATKSHFVGLATRA